MIKQSLSITLFNSIRTTLSFEQDVVFIKKHEIPEYKENGYVITEIYEGDKRKYLAFGSVKNEKYESVIDDH